MKILTIIGARPQFIKAAAFSAALAEYNRSPEPTQPAGRQGNEPTEEPGGKDHPSPGQPIEEKLLHTGQHYDYEMSEQIITQLSLPTPYQNLGIGSGSQGAVTGEMLQQIETEILAEKPDWLLVYGDTNSTLAGALAAAKLHVKVCHVEAGLRSFNKRMPEEINRILTDHVSALLFAPTSTAVKNLRDENITQGVHQTGDIMFDAALRFGEVAEKSSGILEDLGLVPGEYLLATVHRQENTDEESRLAGIFRAFDELASGERPLILPVHPRTAKMLDRYRLKPASEHVRLIKPAGFLEFIKLEKNARLILTDSGGIQKEAYFHGVPCITLREESEWVETLEAGWNQLAGADTARITAAFEKAGPGQPITEYGDGRSAERMIRLLLEHS